MARLNQIIAVEKGVKSRSFQELTEAHHALQSILAPNLQSSQSIISIATALTRLRQSRW